MSVAHTPALFDALKALQRDSKKVMENLDRRLASSPPYTPPGDATASPSTPEDGSGEDNVQKFNRLRSEYNASMPRQQFFAQAKRIEERIVHQLKHPGRRETIPHELNTEPRANAQNFLRSNWCTQEIWEHEWGPPWPPGRRDPVYGPIGPGYVGYEWSKAAKVVSKKRGRRRIAHTEEVYSAASRPLAQFLFQLRLERRWQEDELHYTRKPYTPVDLDAMTYRSLRDIWREDRLWSSSWKVMPGDSDLWLHERMDFATYAILQEDTEGAPAGQTQNPFGSVATSSMSLNVIDTKASRGSSPPSADDQNAERGPSHAGSLFDGTPDQLQKIQKKTLTKPRRSSRLNPNGSAGGSPSSSVCPEISRVNSPRLAEARKARRTRASRRA